MMSLAALAICSLFVLLAEGGKPHPCSTPSLLEGRFTVFNPNKGYEDLGKFSYDALGKRFFMDRVIVTGADERIRVEDIWLFRESVMFQFYPQNRTCVKYPLRAPFQKFIIPQNATFAGQIYLGGSSEPRQGLLINIWSGNIGSGQYIVTVTEFGCIPVSEVYYSKETGWTTESFYDMTTGISDPNVFIPPPECTYLN